LSTGVQRRQTNRKGTDPSVVRVRLKDQTGNPRWATAYLRDVTEEGIGVSLMTPLQIGSLVVIRGTFGENRTDVQLQAYVKWCTEQKGGVYQVGLELTNSQGARARRAAGIRCLRHRSPRPNDKSFSQTSIFCHAG